MQIISSSSNVTMTEPLLSCKDCCSQEENNHHRCNTTRRTRKEATTIGTVGSRGSNHPSSSPSLESSTFFLHVLRPKLFLAGFMFGALMELAYAQSIHLGLTTPIELTKKGGNNNDDKNIFPALVETWINFCLYELSLLYADVMFLLYIAILIWYALKRNLTLSLPILAANWTVGMVLGLSSTVAFLAGPTLVLQKEWIRLALWAMVVGISMCFVAYAAAVESIKVLSMSRRPSSACPFSWEDQTEQEKQTRVHDANSTASLMEAHIV